MPRRIGSGKGEVLCEGKRGRAGKAGMSEGGRLGKAEPCKGKVILHQFHAGKELKLWQVQLPRAGLSLGDESAREALAVMRGIDGEFAEIEVVGMGCQDHAGDGWRTDSPDFSTCLQAVDGERGKGRRRIDTRVHTSKGAGDEGEDGGKVIGRGEAVRLHGDKGPLGAGKVKHRNILGVTWAKPPYRGGFG
jgi:hypothetical protein